LEKRVEIAESKLSGVLSTQLCSFLSPFDDPMWEFLRENFIMYAFTMKIVLSVRFGGQLVNVLEGEEKTAGRMDIVGGDGVAAQCFTEHFRGGCAA